MIAKQRCVRQKYNDELYVGTNVDIFIDMLSIPEVTLTM